MERKHFPRVPSDVEAFVVSHRQAQRLEIVRYVNVTHVLSRRAHREGLEGIQDTRIHLVAPGRKSTDLVLENLHQKGRDLY